MLEKIKINCTKIIAKFQIMFDKILQKLGVERKIREIDFEEIFEDFYKNDVAGSEMILEELRDLFKKVSVTGIMQEFTGNSYSLEIYNKKVIIINNFNNKIGRCELNEFIEKIKAK